MTRASPTHFYNFDEPIKSIRIVRTTTWPPNGCCDPATFFLKSGVRQEFNLPVVASLQIDYAPGKNSSGSQSDTPLGFKDGRYWLINLVPATK